MEILKEGHSYLAQNFEDKFSAQQINFICKEKGSDDELVTVFDGTTNEELLEILIDRLKYLNGKFPCKENSCCITHLEEGLMWLEKRTKDRSKRGVEGKHLK